MHLLAVAETAVRARSRLGGLEEGLGLEFVPPLVGPAFSRRSPFRGRRSERTTEETFDRRFPGVQIHRVRDPRGERPDPGLRQEGLQCRGPPARVGCPWAAGRDWPRPACCRFERLGAELLEEQHLLGERLGAGASRRSPSGQSCAIAVETAPGAGYTRARLAVGRDVEPAVRLAGRRHGIVDSHVGDGPLDATLEEEGPFVRSGEPHGASGRGSPRIIDTCDEGIVGIGHPDVRPGLPGNVIVGGRAEVIELRRLGGDDDG